MDYKKLITSYKFEWRHNEPASSAIIMLTINVGVIVKVKSLQNELAFFQKFTKSLIIMLR